VHRARQNQKKNQKNRNDAIMETPVQISFERMNENKPGRDAITAHVAKLDQVFDRITACHVTVTGPSDRHRKGGLYQVRIRLALPEGREVNVNRTPSADERLADLPFAINDAFHRARRQLQDEVREMQGKTKTHAAPAS
jgi:ribosome-associated translation inhibitor RaiA